MSGVKGNWKLIGAVVAVLATGYFVIFHWDRFLQDFWPVDASRVAPNIVASLVQYAILLVAAYLLYPPFRRAVDRWLRGHTSSLKKHISDEHDAIHEKLDHMIKHSRAIPNQHADGSDWKDRPQP